MKDVAFGAGISNELIERFQQDRIAFDMAETALKEAEKQYRETEETLYDAMLSSGVSSLKIEGLGTCTRTVLGPYCSIDREHFADAEEAFKEWCEQNGHYEEVFRFAPQMQTLNGIVRKMRKEGQSVPPGISVLEHRRIRVTQKGS